MGDQAEKPILHMGCLVCASSRLEPLPAYAHAHLVRCRGCGLTFAIRRPGDAELARHYRHYGTSWYDSATTRRRYGELLDSFEPYRQTNRILDVGCGAGFFLEEARRRGWNAFGSEFGERALELSRAKQLDVVRAPVERNTFAAGSFDVITAFEVVEHWRDPAAEASVLRDALRHGGLFYCTTPNFNAAARRLLRARWPVIEYPEHLCYFTAPTLADLLKRSGFDLTEIQSTGLSPASVRRGLAPPRAHGAPAPSSVEHVRLAVERSSALRVAKRIANRVLGTLSAGDTLKARFERR